MLAIVFLYFLLNFTFTCSSRDNDKNLEPHRKKILVQFTSRFLNFIDKNLALTVKNENVV